MKIFPAVDILGGRCVQLVQGRRESATIYGDPLVCAQQWIEQGATALHIVNLDGAFGKAESNVAEIRRVIRETGVEMQLGGGIRSIADASGWLSTGIDRIIISTYAASDPDALYELADEFGSDRIMAGVDARNDQVVVRGWEEPVGDYLTLSDLFVEKGAGSLLFTNVNVEGLCQGIEAEPVRKLIDRVPVPVTVAGGISSSADVLALLQAGAGGIVLGSALYSGKIRFQDAIRVIQ